MKAISIEQKGSCPDPDGNWWWFACDANGYCEALGPLQPGDTYRFVYENGDVSEEMVFPQKEPRPIDALIADLEGVVALAGLSTKADIIHDLGAAIAKHKRGE